MTMSNVFALPLGESADDGEPLDELRLKRKKRRKKKRVSAAVRRKAKISSRKFRRTAAGKKSAKKRSKIVKKARKLLKGKDISKFSIVASRGGENIADMLEDIQRTVSVLGLTEDANNLRASFEKFQGVVIATAESYQGIYPDLAKTDRTEVAEFLGDLEELHDTAEVMLQAIQEGAVSFTDDEGEERNFEDVLSDMTEELEDYVVVLKALREQV